MRKIPNQSVFIYRLQYSYIASYIINKWYQMKSNLFQIVSVSFRKPALSIIAESLAGCYIPEIYSYKEI